jgi:actin-related protein 3
VARSPEERTTTGLVIDVGESLTSLTPVVEGVTMVSDAVRFPITGRTVTEYLEQLLWEREADVIPRDQSHAIVEAIKQRFCYTAPNMVRELGHYETQPHMYIKQHRGLYDNNRQKEFRVDVGPERFLAPEIFFQPDLVAMSSSSLPETVVALIQASSIEVRRGLYKNIVLSGGSSLFKDFGRRLERDINRIIPAKMVIRPEVKVVSHWMQEHAVWFGASMLGSTPDFYEACTSKADYYEHGPGICRPVMGVGA